MLRSIDGQFKDASGRTVLLRGINFAASAKNPIGQPSWKLDRFWESAEQGQLSFVNRALDLDSEEADVHLTRLKEWGFNCLRYVFTWESIEHAGPGIYDQEYIDYTLKVLKRCKDYGFKVFMDPHQDLFSRFSGGDGAPIWALLAAGLEPRHFSKTIAAVIHSEWPSAETPDPMAFPDMIWATNYDRLACQTINTMFWAGKDFAPKCAIDGVNIQDWLQSHYMNTVKTLATAIAAYDNGSLLDDCVIGWDSMNEPNPGLLSVEDLSVHAKGSVLRVGPMPTAFQAMLLGQGIATRVEDWKFTSTGPKKSGDITIDPQGTRAWLSEERDAEVSAKYGWKRDPGWKLGSCVWALHNVWDPDTQTLLKPNYFHKHPSSPDDIVDFGQDYWSQHWRAYARMIRSCHPNAIHFVHTPVFAVPPVLKDCPELDGSACFSTHFYDGVTLVTKHWNWFNYDTIGVLRGKYKYQWQGVRIGEKAIRKVIGEQLGVLKQDGRDCLGDYPVMMGEIGVPFDLDGRKAYKTGDYSNQIRAWDASMNACDGVNAMSRTMWTYCPDNTHKEGDQWLGEDLSVWSKDDLVWSKKTAADSPTGSMTTNVLYTSVDVFEKGAECAPLQGHTTPPLASAPGKRPISYLQLNNGSRALPAICRPHPIAVVGTIRQFEFDIRSSVFRLEVNVSAHDGTDPEAATEIYVPLVHFASQPRQISEAVKEGYDHHEALDAAARHPLHKFYIFGHKTSNSSFASHSLFSNPATYFGDLAIEVQVSSGRFEVEDQVLKWYYPRPKGGVTTEHISIRRAGGAIPIWSELYGKPRLIHNMLGSVWHSVAKSASCCTIS